MAIARPSQNPGAVAVLNSSTAVLVLIFSKVSTQFEVAAPAGLVAHAMTTSKQMEANIFFIFVSFRCGKFGNNLYKFKAAANIRALQIKKALPSNEIGGHPT